jgi:hypothetical protein
MPRTVLQKMRDGAQKWMGAEELGTSSSAGLARRRGRSLAGSLADPTVAVPAVEIQKCKRKKGIWGLGERRVGNTLRPRSEARFFSVLGCNFLGQAYVTR